MKNINMRMYRLAATRFQFTMKSTITQITVILLAMLKTAPPKTKSRLRFRLGSKFSSQGKSAVSSLGLVEGNSTNTVNTVEETEYSSNDKKGFEATTTFNRLDESQPLSSNQIATVSHQVSTSQTASICPQTNQLQHDSQAISTPVLQSQISTPTIHHHHQQQQQVNQMANNSQISTSIQQHQPSSSSTLNPHAQVKTRKETLEAKRERKAAKTLAIITGAFVVCWLPFFLMALLLPLCDSCHINDKIAAFFLWLGYFNSTFTQSGISTSIQTNFVWRTQKWILSGCGKDSNSHIWQHGKHTS